MNRARAERGDCGVMLWRGVAFVFGETVTRKLLVVVAHQSVARDLGEDTRGSDGITFRITLDERRLLVRQPFDSEAVYEHMLQFRRQLIQRQVHSAPSRLADVDAI